MTGYLAGDRIGSLLLISIGVRDSIEVLSVPSVAIDSFDYLDFVFVTKFLLETSGFLIFHNLR